MELREILTYVDHTLLRQDATWEQIRRIIDEGIEYHTASVCIPPSFVKKASEYGGDRVKICTVIGFPNGYSTTGTKCFETADAVDNGADEIDMVINIGWAKKGKFQEITEEIAAVKKACKGRVLKVIIEACLLTREEKLQLCKAVGESGAEYIKTSTGFGGGGATFEDVALMRENSPDNVLVKAAGGITGIEDAKRFLELGAARLGTSRLVKIAQETGL